MRTYNVVEVFYRKNGEKKGAIFTNRGEATKYRTKLKQQKRKFLGMRSVQLIEA